MLPISSLHAACLKGHTAIAQMLIQALPEAERTAFIKRGDNHGETALHTACRMGQTETARMLN